VGWAGPGWTGRGHRRCAGLARLLLVV